MFSRGDRRSAGVVERTRDAGHRHSALENHHGGIAPRRGVRPGLERGRNQLPGGRVAHLERGAGFHELASLSNRHHIITQKDGQLARLAGIPHLEAVLL